MRRLFAVLISAILAPFVLFAYAFLLGSYAPGGSGAWAIIIWIYPLTAITLWLIYKALRKIE